MGLNFKCSYGEPIAVHSLSKNNARSGLLTQCPFIVYACGTVPGARMDTIIHRQLLDVHTQMQTDIPFVGGRW